MGLPNALIPYGFVYVYGTGTQIGAIGNEAINNIFRFATIYGVGVNMSTDLIGQSVCFLAYDTQPGLIGDGYPYLIVKQDAIIATEVSPP